MNKVIFEERITYPEYIGHTSYWVESDYTGRWMIQTTGEERSLYIECFSLEEVKCSKVKQSCYKIKKYAKWWHFFINKTYEDIKDYSYEVQGTKIKANVRWVSEDNVRVITQNINTCTGECG